MASMTSKQSSSSHSMSSAFGDFGTWGLALPIAQRGLFFRDSYFQRAREHYENSIQNVLASYGLQQSAFADSLQSYRKLRCDNHSEESQAVTATEDDNNYKMVLDVKEFQGGDLKVNVIGDHELLVEGKAEVKESGVSQMRTFRQRFLLPRGVDIQESSSALSSDGILTIITPKVVQHESLAASTQTSTGRPRLMRAKSHIDRDNYSLFDNEFTTGMLPIIRRGHFFSDSFFKEDHDDFNKAMSEVLSKSGLQSGDAFSSYRSLRAKELKEETQAATVSEDDTAQKIIIDVKDFINDGEVNVKVVDDKILIVQGRLDKDEGGATSAKQFKKQFTLAQNVELDSITSVVSADGVLAITAPKKIVASHRAERKIPLLRDIPESVDTPSVGTKHATNLLSQRREHIVPIILEDDDNEEIIQKEKEALHVASSLVEEEAAKLGSVSAVECIPVPKKSVPDMGVSAGAYRRGGIAAGAIFAGMVPTGAAITGAIPAALDPRRGGPSEGISAFIAAAGGLSAGALLANAMSPASVSLEPLAVPTPTVSPPATAIPAAPHALTAPTSPLPATVPESIAMDPIKRAVINHIKDRRCVEPGPGTGATQFLRVYGFVPVLKKGEFDTDPHFENDKLDFETAIKTALQTKGIEAAAGEELNTYQNMRKTSANDEDVAFSFTEHHYGYQIVLDMEDYVVREPKLQLLSDNDLLIEGVADRKDEDGESIYFRRQFVFSKVVNMEAMSSAISSEGVLTIEAPFKVARITKANAMGQEEAVISTEKSVEQFNLMVGTYLDIQKRQSFATDTIFQEPKIYYPSAIRAALKRSGCHPQEGETEATAYIRLRQTNRKEENQAVMSLEGYDNYKVIVDMQEYLNTEIKVKLLGFNTFVIECYQEMSGKSKQIWSRQFVFPSHINMENITGILSEDGILVLTVPKRVCKQNGNTDASGMRVGWVKSYPNARVFSSETSLSGICTSHKTLPFKGLRNW